MVLLQPASTLEKADYFFYISLIISSSGGSQLLLHTLSATCLFTDKQAAMIGLTCSEF